MSELGKRKHKRTAWNRPGVIFSLTGEHIIDCLVKDISAGGARLWVSVEEVVPDYFRLDYGAKLQPKCSVRWRRATEIGIRFLLT
jgi:PilZ domain